MEDGDDNGAVGGKIILTTGTGPSPGQIMAAMAIVVILTTLFLVFWPH